MPPRRKLTPSYLLHKQSGRGRLVWTDHTGNRRQKLLPGAFGSPESLVAKARLELELVTSSAAAPGDRGAGHVQNRIHEQLFATGRAVGREQPLDPIPIGVRNRVPG